MKGEKKWCSNSRAEEKPFCFLESRTPVQAGKHPAEIKPYIPLSKQICFEIILQFLFLNRKTGGTIIFAH